MYIIPDIDDELKKFAKDIGCNWIGAIAIESKPLCKELNCHNNVLTYTSMYGGEQKLGYYFIKNIKTKKYEAILHSVLNKSNKLIDITPFSDDREYNIVGLIDGVDISKNSKYITQ